MIWCVPRPLDNIKLDKHNLLKLWDHFRKQSHNVALHGAFLLQLFYMFYTLHIVLDL